MIKDIVKLGRHYRVMVPDDSPESMWQHGIVIGPPDLSSLELPPSVELRLHNELFVRGLIQKQDVQRRMPELIAALQYALNVDAQRIAELYTK